MIIGGAVPVKRIAIALFASGITDRQSPCRFCKAFTTKVIAFKAPVTAPIADLLWCCDYCLEAIQKMHHTHDGL